MPSPVRRWVTRQAMARGVFGGSQFWLIVGLVMGFVRVLRRLGGHGPEILYSEELGPRDRLLISVAEDE